MFVVVTPLYQRFFFESILFLFFVALILYIYHSEFKHSPFVLFVLFRQAGCERRYSYLYLLIVRLFCCNVL